MATFRKFTRRLFLISNVVAVTLFLLACANAILHPGRWWLISLLGLVFPLLLLILLAFFIFALFFTSLRRWSLLSLFALLLGWSNIHSFWAFHMGKGFQQEKPASTLRLLTWNVRSFDDYVTKKKGALAHKPKMMEFIRQQNADVVCLQEFYNARKAKSPDEDNLAYIRDSLHYPYSYFSRDFARYDGAYEGGVVIFSRFPITDSLILRYPREDRMSSQESLIAADLLIGKDTVRIYTTHLQSVLFRSKDFHDIEIIKNVEDSILQASRSIAKKLSYAFRKRGNQAEQVRTELDKSPYPGLICGDFNDVPNSYTYFTIRGGWNDAFISKGFGIGRTYVYISPTLRIDYILADPRLPIAQCRKFPLPYSDHNPVVADLRLP
jgi:endonuclease/exonuclease/phosphatase family metal-dependent hydrolase